MYFQAALYYEIIGAYVLTAGAVLRDAVLHQSIVAEKVCK
jgi:hypothetical protein